MDLTTLKAVVFELDSTIIPSRFEKAQQPDSNTIQLGFRTLENLTWIEISWLADAPRIVKIDSPKRIGDKSTLAKQLHHLLSHLALIEIKQTGFERIVKFGLASRPGSVIEKVLIVELMGRHSNLMILDKKSKVITLGKQVKDSQSRLRPIGTGDSYISPPGLKGIAPNLNESFKIWKENLCLVPSTFKDALRNTYQGISPSITLQLADMNYKKAKSIINQPVHEISQENWENIFKRWTKWLLTIKDKNFSISLEGPTEFIVWGNNQLHKEKKDISLFLGSYYKKKLINRKLINIKNKIEKGLIGLKTDQLNQLKGQISLLEGIEEYLIMQEKANNILSLENPQKSQIIEAQNLFKEAKRKKRSRDSIIDRITYHRKRINDIESSELFLISLINDQISDNQERLDRMIELEEEIEEYIFMTRKNKPNRRSERSKNKSLSCTEIQSPSGLSIQIGRNHCQNELISLKKGRKGDLWFHAQESPGSHIVLKSSNGIAEEQDIQLAADMASLFSRARGNKVTPVIMVPIENLQRISGALPGTVRHRGGKVVWGESDRAEKHFHQN